MYVNLKPLASELSFSDNLLQLEVPSVHRPATCWTFKEETSRS